MPYDPKRHHRRSIRLRGYDYAQPGEYFLTIITENRAHLYGEIVDGEMRLSPAGEVVARCWYDIPNHFPHAALDAFQVMPNHIHGVLVFTQPVKPSQRTEQIGERPRGTSMTVGSVVRGFKIGVTKWMRANTQVYDVWHRNYWEHIVRNPAELERIRRYIENNPLQWELDRMNAATDRKYGRGPNDWKPPVHKARGAVGEKGRPSDTGLSPGTSASPCKGEPCDTELSSGTSASPRKGEPCDTGLSPGTSASPCKGETSFALTTQDAAVITDTTVVPLKDNTGDAPLDQEDWMV
jgi:REP element-mobilizing transposase RayT